MTDSQLCGKPARACGVRRWRASRSKGTGLATRARAPRARRASL